MDSSRSSRVPRMLPALALVVCACALAPRPACAADDKPFFLVATRDLAGSMFEQTVILMLPPTNPPLVAGLIVNKPTAIKVRKVFPGAATLNDHAATAYFGGPVDLDEPSILVRAAQAPAGTTALLGDIYLGQNPDVIARLLKDPDAAKDLRLFLGKAQWTLDQLHGEIMRGSWYVMPAKSETVFSADPDHVWRALVKRAELQEVRVPELNHSAGFELLPCNLSRPQ